MSIDAAHSLRSLGTALKNSGKYDESLEKLNKAREIIGKIKGKESVEMGDLFLNIGNTYNSQGNNNKALESY